MQPSLPSTRISLPVSMRPQPDGRSCGPTSLQAVYDYGGADAAFSNLLSLQIR